MFFVNFFNSATLFYKIKEFFSFQQIFKNNAIFFYTGFSVPMNNLFKNDPISTAQKNPIKFTRTFSVNSKFYNKLNFISLINLYAFFVKASSLRLVGFTPWVGFAHLFWVKTRVVYYINNWVYTTNHKRIAVNYFWFVILSGIVGMVLATLIRLEFAYPGAGVFVGDSLQYLSLATAHGVIMVFFMIMPLLFGAFANFLLPTQLGVHDVAFPRLNSAAFWFLPGGLLMLCQLVCVDKRYQRMNCFNIREVQSILKKKFYPDLINSHDHHTFLSKTAMGLRFKTTGVGALTSNNQLFYNYGIETMLRSKINEYSSFETQMTSFDLNSKLYFFIKSLKNSHLIQPFSNFFLAVSQFIVFFFYALTHLFLTLKSIFILLI